MGQKILLVEDEVDLRQIYALALRSDGFEVLEADNGKKALDVLEKEYGDISLIVLDIVMPVLDGMESLQKIKGDARFRNIPVVIATNLDNEEDREEALKLGAQGYFVKAMHTPREMVDKVRKICGARQG